LLEIYTKGMHVFIYDDLLYMNDLKDKILKYIKKRKIVRRRDLKEIGAPPYYLNLLESEGKVQKLGRGLYCSNDYEFDEKQSYIEICKRVPHGVICLLSALTFYEITTQNPYQIWVAVDRKAKPPKLDYPPIRAFQFSGKAFTEGVEKIKRQGTEIKVYCPAKTVADCFKYRNKIGIDVAIEALRDTWRRKLLTLKELNYYAKICRVQKVMKPYVESLI